MRQTIRVERLLRESVETPYCDLVTRTTGRLVRTSIQEALAAGDAPVTLLDFSEVGLVDLSCADEIIAKLLLDPPATTYLVLQGLREEQLEAIEHVLEHHDLAALVCDPGARETRPVGRISPDLRTAFFTIQSLGGASVEELAAGAAWPVDRALAAVEALVRLRLIRPDGPRYLAPFDA